ncbi:hypothetical protein ACFVGN_05560 [Streptomyces sp. NPDC057757]|uniref:hypothetical protein n=1 Tax=Streptomyces sp. NPDC057757 TaxID=3346241 RepID=UPI0036B1357B
MSERMRFVLQGDDDLTPVFNRAGDSSARLHRRLNDDMQGNTRAVTAFTRDANGRLRDLNGRFLSAADASRVMGNGLPDLTRRLGDVAGAGGDAASSLGKSGGGGLGGVMMALAAAAALSLLPALGALVPMMLGGALAAGTLKLGFNGVADAMAAAGKGKKEYAKALDKLSPPAREFTKALVGLKKEFGPVGKEVQKAMLPSFTKAVKDAGPVVKILGKGMTELGGSFGKAAEGAGRLFKNGGFQKDLKANLDLGRQFVGDLTSGVGRLGRSFLDFGAKSKPTLTSLSGGIRDLLGNGLPGMFSGLEVGIQGSAKFLDGLFSMINKALPAIGRFSGEVARSVGPMLGELFKSAGVSGAGALDTLGQVVKGLTPVFKDLGFGLKSVTQLMRIIGPTVKDTAAAIVGVFLPSFNEVDKAKGPLQRLSASIQENKGAIQEFSRQGATAFLTLVEVGVRNLPNLIKVFRIVTGGMVTALGGVLHAAAATFGWLPGIGGKLKAADKAFQSFKDSYISGLKAAEQKATSFAATTLPKLSAGQLKVNISNWTSQLETAKAKLKTVPPEKRAALKANIADLQSKVNQARRDLNSLNGKTATTYVVTRFSTTGTGSKVAPAKRDYATGGPIGFPGGGPISGPGTGTSDSIPIMASNGEYMINARSTAKYRPIIEAINKGTFGTGRGMPGAGAAVAQGLISGMTGSTGQVSAAAAVMAYAVVTGIKGELQISSPSRVTKALAADVGKGFVEGMTASRDKIRAVARDLANDIRAALSGRKESSLVAYVNKQTGRLLSAAAKRDAIAAKISEAKGFMREVSSNARQGAALNTLGMEPEQVTAGGIKAGLASKLSQIRQFTRYVEILAKKGLNKSLLRQILNMGPEAGYAYASALVGADKGTFKSINALQSTLDKSTTKLGAAGADALYDSGKNASKGFLKGLESQQKAIEDFMVKIAKGMQKALRRALGINSPARKLIPDGINTARGIGLGLLAGLPYIDSAMGTVAGRMTGVVGRTAVPGRPAVAGGGGATVIHLNIEAGPGSDPHAVWLAVRTGLLSLKRHHGMTELGLA